LFFASAAASAQPDNQFNCPYEYNEFVNLVKSKCASAANKQQCVQLAKECPRLTNEREVPASARFMASIDAGVLKAMFDAGLQPPLPNKETDIMAYSLKLYDRDKFICAMIINHSQKLLPFENFKVIYEKSGFDSEELDASFCIANKDSGIVLKPHELAAVLNDKVLAAFFKEQKIKITKDFLLNIPLDLWAPDYYTTKKSQILINAIHDPKYLKIIDSNFDYSILMPEGTQILFVGEVHYGGYYKAAVDLINGLKCNPGLTHFASEFLLEMQQDDIDAFRKTNNVCKIKMTPRLLTSGKGRKILGGLNRINTACLGALGCDIDIAPLERTETIIDQKEEDHKKAKKEYIKMYDAKKRSALEKEQRNLKIININLNLIAPSGIKKRNLDWAEVMDKQLKQDKSAKAFAYMGKGHSVGFNEKFFNIPISTSVPELMKKKGYNVRILSISGGHMALLPDAFMFKTFNLKDKYFLFIVPEELRKDMGMDYIVHLPTTGAQEAGLKKWLKSNTPAQYYNLTSERKIIKEKKRPDMDSGPAEILETNPVVNPARPAGFH
ncbi:MAG: TraB/GumN family protein, partial [Elusimicrobiota bacterium]|nr:TraB/GumN family protein [Elusimicrobiota bacterium]